MIHRWQSDLTLVSKADKKKKNQPGLSVILMAELNSHLLASPSRALLDARNLTNTIYQGHANTGNKKLVKGSSYHY